MFVFFIGVDSFRLMELSNVVCFVNEVCLIVEVLLLCLG